jgi:CBS domain-containing protein
MQVREIMTEQPTCCTPEAAIRYASRLMRQRDCGCLPVVTDSGTNRIVGVVTDRDIAMRAVAEGKSPDTTVGEVMSSEPQCCHADADVEEVERIMTEQQVRRVPVIDERGCCVGIVAQADLARAAERSGSPSEQVVARVVERISESGARAQA